jgi:hypothetical protein
MIGVDPIEVSIQFCRIKWLSKQASAEQQCNEQIQAPPPKTLGHMMKIHKAKVQCAFIT